MIYSLPDDIISLQCSHWVAITRKAGYSMKKSVKAYLREKKNSKCYSCILKWEEGGKPRSKELSTGIEIKGNNKRIAKKRVEEIRADFEKKVARNGFSEYKDILFEVYIEKWVNEQESYLKPTTLSGYKGIAKNHIVPFFSKMHVLLVDITPQHIQEYYNTKVKEGLSPGSIQRHHSLLRKALQNAVLKDVILFNPADKTQRPRQTKYCPSIYDVKQLKLLLQAVNGTPIETPVILCCHYALRRGEILGLQWKNIDFENRTIAICGSVVRAGKTIYQDSTKSQSSNRILPINDEIYEYLKKIKKKREDNRKIFGNCYCENDFVCTWDDGRPLAPEYLSRAFKRVLKKNGLPPIRLHDTRHSVATGLLKSGIDLKVIQEYLGHSTIGITANYYLHPDINEKTKALERMEKLLQ